MKELIGPQTADLLNLVEPFIVLVMVIFSSVRLAKLKDEVKKLHKDADNLADLIGTKTAKARKKSDAMAKLKGE
jgi:hypothetical protein